MSVKQISPKCDHGEYLIAANAFSCKNISIRIIKFSSPHHAHRIKNTMQIMYHGGIVITYLTSSFDMHEFISYKYS